MPGRRQLRHAVAVSSLWWPRTSRVGVRPSGFETDRESRPFQPRTNERTRSLLKTNGARTGTKDETERKTDLLY
ncbi:hypothetical protein PI126_g6681 [Phytophthora idaei]|nr:hypothetical protein PI126_g6681 [Phytophthora idaei]